MSHMSGTTEWRVGLSELREHLGPYVGQVQNGRVLTILRNGYPAALVIPLHMAHAVTGEPEQSEAGDAVLP